LTSLLLYRWWPHFLQEFDVHIRVENTHTWLGVIHSSSGYPHFVPVPVRLLTAPKVIHNSGEVIHNRNELLTKGLSMSKIRAVIRGKGKRSGEVFAPGDEQQMFRCDETGHEQHYCNTIIFEVLWDVKGGSGYCRAAEWIVAGSMKFMANNTAIQQATQLPREHASSGLASLLHGSLTSLACKCSLKDTADFLIKQDRIVCGFCGREILCLPPIMGVYKATCGCCSSTSIKSTFVLDSRGIYICTWCGRSR
jgi:hypothetical protein